MNMLTRDWSTHPEPEIASPVPWKKYIGEACPHGRHVALVDGMHIRNTCDSDFCQGGNGFAYPNFVPKDEIWIDQCIPEEEWALIVFHECMEAEYMEKGGMSYDKAHERVKAEEDAFRRLLIKKKAS
jgi:hypothetical protein